MKERNRFLSGLVWSLVIIIVMLSIAIFYYYRNGEALWRIVSEQCVPAMAQHSKPAPCKEVNLRQGHVIYKDIKGPHHYLLMPIEKISGMESPVLLDPDTPNFLAAAWQHRDLLVQGSQPVSDSAFSLAINAQYGRSQNQLHIHLSCLRPEVRQQLDSQASHLHDAWQPVTINRHRYLVRAISEAHLFNQSAFIRLAKEVAGAREKMGHYGMALTALPDGRLALLALERNWLMLNGGSAGELQDYQCQLLNK
ncbi:MULTISPECIES: CDP-diacylglycerol diphosphatase [Pantoea]|jgi:CDP-diacylglycerol pyrophosphatase|uniref:CDP-diacylglycerol diphosphatase n=2 Tax=Erwiniaceae TaxID=1903409 RepID=UPI0008FD6A08|nr:MULTISPECIES: CDP-diacylglycerol diphosphatase [Pantoea]MDJ0022970.1 CDP-diacylglycerol diphosphatase [Pantoea eucrina]OIX96508.1 CDP-diacylglycerol diphosphatase [Pantoea sp. Ae16]